MDYHLQSIILFEIKKQGELVDHLTVTLDEKYINEEIYKNKNRTYWRS